MATAKKKTAAKPAKASAARKTTTARKTTSRRKKKSSTTPLLGLLIMAVGIVLLFCLVSPTNAMAIVYVRSFLNGNLGQLAPVVVLLVIVGGLQMGFGERWPFQRVLWLQAALLTFCIATMLQVFRVNEIMGKLGMEKLVQNYNGFLWKSYDISRNVPYGGGPFGGLLAYPMQRYMGVAGSVLVLVFAIIGIGIWMLQTLMPSFGDRVNEWFDEMREEWAIRKQEREDERLEMEAYEEARLQEAQANAAPVPDDFDTAEPILSRKGQKKKRAEKARQAAEYDAEWERAMGDTQDDFMPELMSATRSSASRGKKAAAPPADRASSAAKRTAVKPVQRSAKLYIEYDGDAPPAIDEQAYTEYDAERAKYATRPSRKDPEAVPDFMTKRRTASEETLDAQAGQSAEDQVSALWAETDAEYAEYAQATQVEEPPVYEDAYASYDDDDEDPLPVKREQAPRRPYFEEDPMDRTPQLDPQTRLDRPDWTPPEPVEPMVEETDEPLYRQPPFTLLERDDNRARTDTRDQDAASSRRLEETLKSFGVSAKVTNVVHGPVITRYELLPAPGVKVSKITGLTDDIALHMAAVGVRIEAPIPGKAVIGIEVANDEKLTVHLRDVLESDASRRNASKLAVALGKDIAGECIIADLAKMPHLLIAGQTGSGKSVCINTIIASIIYRATPEEVRLILIDPKKVELSAYNGVPHLLVPVVTDPKKASGALNWAVSEMDERYKRFEEAGVRNIKGYNGKLGPDEPLMPQIVVIIDELADLMIVAPGEVEESINRIAQLARACGIHLVVATQRPSVNVITGVIKANIPSRIAFEVQSQVDSRTILDGAGAEKLLGMGDMLFAPSGGGKPKRVQGCFISDDEVHRVTEYVKDQATTDYSQAVIDALDTVEEASETAEANGKGENVDSRFDEAVDLAMEMGHASISMVQRRMRVGYARAGRIVDDMARLGIIGPPDGAKPREVLITREEYVALYKQ